MTNKNYDLTGLVTRIVDDNTSERQREADLDKMQNNLNKNNPLLYTYLSEVIGVCPGRLIGKVTQKTQVKFKRAGSPTSYGWNLRYNHLVISGIRLLNRNLEEGKILDLSGNYLEGNRYKLKDFKLVVGKNLVEEEYLKIRDFYSDKDDILNFVKVQNKFKFSISKELYLALFSYVAYSGGYYDPSPIDFGIELYKTGQNHSFFHVKTKDYLKKRFGLGK